MSALVVVSDGQIPGCDKWSCRATDFQTLGEEGPSEVWEKGHELIGLHWNPLFGPVHVVLGWNGDFC